MSRRRRPRRWVLAVSTCLLVLAADSSAWAVGRYVQPLNGATWDTPALDVLIVPPEHGQIYNGNGPLGGGGANEVTPFQNSYLRAIESSIASWDRAIDEIGAEWLSSAVKFNVYVLGRDSVPQPALEDPEIVIVTSTFQGVILGWALSSNLEGQQRCVINNSKFFIQSFTYEDMYNVHTHEFGHCLGLSHSYGTPDDDVVEHDVMYASYMDGVGNVGTHRHCVSNMNMRGVENAFAPLLGQPGGGEVTMDPAEYRRTTC